MNVENVHCMKAAVTIAVIIGRKFCDIFSGNLKVITNDNAFRSKPVARGVFMKGSMAAGPWLSNLAILTNADKAIERGPAKTGGASMQQDEPFSSFNRGLKWPTDREPEQHR